MLKVYKMRINQNSYDYVAANSFKEARLVFAKEKGLKKYITNKINGEALLKENPSHERDYLKIDGDKGVLPPEKQLEFFQGDKDEIDNIPTKLRQYIDKQIEKVVEEYFDEQIPDLKE